MENLGKLSFRETLTIMIPGVFIILSLTPLISEKLYKDLALNDSNLNLLLMAICSFLIGIILYIIDLPKNIPFFKKATPTEQISNKLKELKTTIEVTRIHNAYFQFYDKIVSVTQKDKTDRLTSIYHFTMNLFLGSLFVLLVYFACWIYTGNVSFYWIPVLLIGISSLISTLGLFYGKRKIKYYFDRQFSAFINSDNYTDLIT